MSNTTDAIDSALSKDATGRVEAGPDRTTRLIQAMLAVYLLPALAMVLLVGFLMIALGGLIQLVSKVTSLIISPWGPRRAEPAVSGAWVYRVSGGSLAKRSQNDAQPAVAHAGWCQTPESDDLN